MGGNAFEDLQKLSPQEYEKIKNQVLYIVSPLCEKIQPYIPLPEKKVHGDIDFLLIFKPKFTLNDIMSVMKLTKEEYIINNNATANTVYHKKQIDFNAVADIHELERTRLYKSYSGIGAFLGLLLPSKLIKFNQEGIFCCHYHKHHKIQFLVCSQPREILKFYGLNPDRYAQGFNTRLEVFHFLLEGRFLNVEQFKSKKPKWTTKLIDSFQQFLKENNDLSNPKYEEVEDPVAMTLKYFDKQESFEKHWAQKLAEQEKKKDRSQKWNGKHILDVFGVPTKELNGLKKKFQAFFKNVEEEQHFIDNHTFLEIVEAFSKVCQLEPVHLPPKNS